jgi:hypothetical protein
MSSHKHISIWFFVGLLLTVYGALILFSGLRDPGTTVLAELHAGIWWGGLLLVLGGVYLYMFSPRRTGR